MLVHIRNSIWPHHFVAQRMYRHIHDVTIQLQSTSNGDQGGRQKGSELHHRVEFLRNYYTFESVHDGDHNSVGLSCGFFNYIVLHYMEQFFFPTRSV